MFGNATRGDLRKGNSENLWMRVGEDAWVGEGVGALVAEALRVGVVGWWGGGGRGGTVWV